jgi:hypothetical protein
MQIEVAVRPQPSAPYKFPQLENYVRLDISFVSQGKIGMWKLSTLSPDNIECADFEGNRCRNLSNFMEFIKVFPTRGHLDGDQVTAYWKQWKLRGFYNKFRIRNPNNHAFSYDGVQMNAEEEEQYFEKLYVMAVRRLPAFAELQRLHKTSNILLLDMDLRVPLILKKMLQEAN